MRSEWKWSGIQPSTFGWCCSGWCSFHILLWCGAASLSWVVFHWSAHNPQVHWKEKNRHTSLRTVLYNLFEYLIFTTGSSNLWNVLLSFLHVCRALKLVYFLFYEFQVHNFSSKFDFSWSFNSSLKPLINDRVIEFLRFVNLHMFHFSIIGSFSKSSTSYKL